MKRTLLGRAKPSADELEKWCFPSPPPDLSEGTAALFAAWEAARREKDWPRADVLRTQLRALGVNPNAAQRTDHTRYDAAWAERTRALTYMSTAGYLASSIGWEHSPKLQTFRAISTTEARDETAKRLGHALLAQMTEPCVVCIEKPYLTGMAAAFDEEQRPRPPFVLLVVNGGDEPFTREMQAQVRQLRGVRACYANNLHVPAATTAGDSAAEATSASPTPSFHPLPLGLPGDAAPHYFEAALEAARAKLPPWETRDRRLLVAPMRPSSRARTTYIELLSRAPQRSSNPVQPSTTPPPSPAHVRHAKAALTRLGCPRTSGRNRRRVRAPRPRRALAPRAGGLPGAPCPAHVHALAARQGLRLLPHVAGARGQHRAACDARRALRPAADRRHWARDAAAARRADAVGARGAAAPAAGAAAARVRPPRDGALAQGVAGPSGRRLGRVK